MDNSQGFLGDCINTFVPSRQTDTAEGATGWCESSSDEFVKHVQDLGGTAHTHEFNYPLRARFPSQSVGWAPRHDQADQWDGFHYAPVVELNEGPYVVDWTARQLKDDADFPLVEALDQYGDGFGYHLPRG